MTPGRITIFTSPDPLGKVFTLDAEGKLHKKAAGQMTRGAYRVETYTDASTFKSLLLFIKPNEAICSSVPLDGSTSGTIVTEAKRASTSTAKSRTKACFQWSGAAPLILDFDVPTDGKVIEQAELWNLLQKHCPGLANAPVMWWPSASSFIFNGSKSLCGLGGQRVYILAQDVTDTKRFTDTLAKRLWLDGFGRIDVSDSGSLLVRGIFDEAMSNVARLDFAPGGAVCRAPLEQRRGDPVILADGPFFDTCSLLDLTPDDEALYIGLLESAKSKAEPLALAKRKAWRDAREKEELTAVLHKGGDLDEARVRIARTLEAALGGSLLGTFPIVILNADGLEQNLTVDQVLADRQRYHLSACLDPLNPNHRDRSADAILYTNQAHPVIYSLDGGGTVYRLLRQPTRLAVVQGEKAALAEQIADRLAEEPDLFTVAGQVVRIVKGALTQVSRPKLLYVIGCRVALYRQGKDRQLQVDAENAVLDMVLALLPERLHAITGRATMPLITEVGRIVDRPGFDKETGIYLDWKPGDVEPVTDAPSREQTIEALRRAWARWRQYKWATPDDRAAMLASVLTTVIRPMIDAAPGAFADSYVQGSGKSKAVGAVAAVARGRQGGAKSWIADENEIEKYLLSAIRLGEPAIIFDNVLGVFRSQGLATSIAEGKLNARLLGTNDMKSIDARVMWLASGNNCSLDRDMATRWLTCRIDTGVENPQALSYSFDPQQEALADRIGIARSAVIVHRAYHQAGRPRADDIDTRFATWGRSVRQLCLWLRESGIAGEAGIGPLGDPAASILQGSSANDPESESWATVLFGLWETFTDKVFTTGDVHREFRNGEQQGNEGQVAIFDGFSGLLPARSGGISAQTLNSAMKNRRDRIVNGLRLVKVNPVGSAAMRSALWRVKPAQPDHSAGV